MKDRDEQMKEVHRQLQEAQEAEAAYEYDLTEGEVGDDEGEEEGDEDGEGEEDDMASQIRDAIHSGDKELYERLWTESQGRAARSTKVSFSDTEPESERERSEETADSESEGKSAREYKTGDRRLKLPNFPQVIYYDQWQMQVCDQICMFLEHESERSVLKWFQQFKTSTLEELGKTGKSTFRKVDRDLAIQLRRAIPPRLGDKVSEHREKSWKENKQQKGRQILWFIHEHFKLNEHMVHVYDITHLTSLEWRGEDQNQLSVFIKIWKKIIENLKKNSGINDITLRDILMSKIPEDTKAFAIDMQKFNEMAEDDRVVAASIARYATVRRHVCADAWR